MGRLFGTDGIRGLANTYPMTAEIALKTGRALALTFNRANIKKIVIGKDTRLSGDVFESALTAGLCSMGTDVYQAGVIPTPGIAYLSRTMDDVAAGVVISASHNPYQDNGIKVFNGEGFKLDDQTEAALESIILDDQHESLTKGRMDTGRVHTLHDAVSQYQRHLKFIVPGLDLSGLKAVIDCSNGASSVIAPALFRETGLDVTALFTKPDGKNINHHCGSEHLDVLVSKVRELKADIGLAFDGDADRLIAVDRFGKAVSGDQLIAICAKLAMEEGRLANNTVVTTVMSNMGLGVCLKRMGITHVMSQVGDRNVMLDMVKTGAVVGGEDSGHMIFLNHHTTGDGMISALKVLEAMKRTSLPLHELSAIMTIFPQKLVNVDVREKPDISTVPEIVATIRESEAELAGEGRVLVRYSGTQSMCRVMVEAPTVEDTEKYVNRIAGVVRRVLG